MNYTNMTSSLLTDISPMSQSIFVKILARIFIYRHIKYQPRIYF